MPEPPLSFVPVPTRLPACAEVGHFAQMILGPKGRAVDALGYVFRLWTFAATHFVSGKLPKCIGNALASECGWQGRSADFLKALTDSGLLLSIGKHFTIAFYQQNAQKLLDKRLEHRERGRAKGFRQALIEKSGGRCHYCKHTYDKLHIDHVRPISKGGKSIPANLVVACAPCNLAKGAKEFQNEQ